MFTQTVLQRMHPSHRRQFLDDMTAVVVFLQDTYTPWDTTVPHGKRPRCQRDLLV